METFRWFFTVLVKVKDRFVKVQRQWIFRSSHDTLPTLCGFARSLSYQYPRPMIRDTATPTTSSNPPRYAFWLITIVLGRGERLVSSKSAEGTFFVSLRPKLPFFERQHDSLPLCTLDEAGPEYHATPPLVYAEMCGLRSLPHR
jgi:hypothetical protein